MTPPLKPHWTELWTELSGRLASAQRLLVACDFDGTLTRLVDRPELAELPGPVREVLVRLGSQCGVRVALVSGRALADLRQRAEVPGAIYAGNHGLEMAGAGLDRAHGQASALREDLGRAMADLSRQLAAVPGILLEDKGLTGSIHYRLVPAAEHNFVRETVRQRIGTENSLVVRPGKFVWEVRPRVTWDKGSAVRHMIARLGVPAAAVVYLGDDVTDEDAFRVLGSGLTFIVHQQGDTAAKYRIDDPPDVLRFLTALADVRTPARLRPNG